MIRDELSGLLRPMEKPDRCTDRSFYLEAWDGLKLDFHYDRIGRGHILIPSPTVSVLGTIRPGPLQAMLRDVARGEAADDGLIARFQLLVWPDVETFKNVDRSRNAGAPPGRPALPQPRHVPAPGAGRDPGRGRRPAVPPVHRGSPALPRRLAGLPREHHAPRRRHQPAGGVAPVEVPEAGPGIALLFHLADVLDGPDPVLAGVSRQSLERAIEWSEILEGHARRVYGSLDAPDFGAARARDKLQKGLLPSPFTYRDVYHRTWGKLDDASSVRRAVAHLEELGWLRTVEVRDTGGGPRTDIHIHPAVARKEAEPA